MPYSPYRLALDVGTASCGLIVWTLDGQGRPSKLAYNSLDIWPEPLQPAKSGGVGQPKKAARRDARLMRRQTDRRARRLRRIAHLASKLGLSVATIAPDDGQHIHRLRAQAAEEQIALEDFLRVLLHLAKNRGPSGDWVYAEPEESTNEATETDKKAAEEKRDIVAGVRKLEGLMQEAAHALGKDDLTLGQYLHYRRQRGESVILGKPEIGLYPSRRMVEQEFNRIWDAQANFHSVLKDETVRKQFYDAIFHQRPLKSPAPMVGHCPLEPTLPRAPAAQMAAQTFRIEKQMADLRWGIGRHAAPLSPEQKTVLRELLNDTDALTQKGELSFKKILAAFGERGCHGPMGRGLNMHRASRESLKGNTTLATFGKLGLESEWHALAEKTQVQVINFLAELGSPEALDSEDWHLNFETTRKDPVTRHKIKRQFAPELVAFINRLREHPKFARLSAMGFDGGRMGYSIKALRKLTVLMQEGRDERAAVDQAYPDYNKPKGLADQLPLPESTGNTVVDVALRQVYRAVRRAMEAMGGPPTEVIVELSRDMALGVKKRGEIERKINKNKQAREKARKAIQEHGEHGTDKEVDRYLLWEQQMHYCAYCERRLTLHEALSGSEANFEHILPKTLTRVGRKRSQQVLACKECNNKKGNRTPWQAFCNDEARWKIIEDRASILEKNRERGKARLLLLKDWEAEVLDNEAIAGFSDRQFHESSWIAKLTAHWLRGVCANVAVSRGELTAHLRRIWKLDTVIPEVRIGSGLPALDRDGKPILTEEFRRHKSWWEGHKESAGGVPTDRKPDKRIDHRHHLLDALVISLSDCKLFRRMAENYKAEREKESVGERAKLGLYEAPPIPGLRDLAMELVTNAEIRHKPDRHPDGPLFGQTAYGISREPDEAGNYKLAYSKPLAALIDKKSDAKKTRSVLEKIESEATRVAVLEAFDKRITVGTDVKRVFDEPILHPQFKTPVRRVRLLGNSADTAATIIHENRHGKCLEKRYPHSGNAYLEVQVKDGKLVGKPRLVTAKAAMQEKNHSSPDVSRFWKGDTILLPDGSKHVVGQIKDENRGKLCLVPITETCTYDELPKKRGMRKRSVSGRSLATIRVIDV